jgi:hypothetical protein
MFLHVTSVRHIKDYKLEVAFSDGSLKEVDLASELFGEVFEPLNDIAFFEQAFVNEETNTVEWPNGADFAPEYLLEQGQEVTPVA